MAIRQFEAKGFFTDNLVVGATPSQTALLDLPMIKTDIKKDVEEEEITGTVDGSCEVQTLDTIIKSTKFSMSFNIEKLRSDALALIYGESWATQNNQQITDFKQVQMPTSGVIEITDTASIAASTTVADVRASILVSGTWGLSRPLEVISTGTPTANQVLLNAATGKLTLAASNAGATIKYSVNRVIATGWESLGVAANPRKLNKLFFRGMLCSTEPEIVMVEADLSPSGGFSLPIGDKGVTLEYKAVVKPGQRSPVRFFRKAA